MAFAESPADARVGLAIRGRSRTRGEGAIQSESQTLLMLQAGSLRCALPLPCVVETLRPLGTQQLANAPEFVLGVCVIRGEVLPVVDLARLLNAATTGHTRWVVVRTGDRAAALAVDSVLGFRSAGPEMLAGVPALLSNAHPDIITMLGVLDRQLLLMLETAHLVPEDVWASLDRAA